MSTKSEVLANEGEEYVAGYEAGWRYSGSDHASLDAASDRIDRPGWEDGYMDRACDRPKWTVTPSSRPNCMCCLDADGGCLDCAPKSCKACHDRGTPDWSCHYCGNRAWHAANPAPVSLPAPDVDDNRETIDVEEFVSGFITAALWADCIPVEDNGETGGGEHLTVSGQDREDVAEDCRAFIAANRDDLGEYADRREFDPSQGTISSYAGHDAYLTAARHGTGFWDRDLGDLGDRLTASAGAMLGQWEHRHFYAHPNGVDATL